MLTRAMFPTVPRAAGMYESFYLRAVAPERPIGIWIRYTVHKRPDAEPKGSLWFTLFDSCRDRPLQQKLTTSNLSIPSDGWIAVGDAAFGPQGAEGSSGGASWSLQLQSHEPELRHISPGWLYRARLPRTKLTSPVPAATFTGAVELPGPEKLSIDGWSGMVGHNWGAEHAERWVWIHGVGFAGHPSAWLDLAIGRVKLAGRMTPWVANGAISLDGRRYRVGGLAARGTNVAESVEGCRLRVAGERGMVLDGSIEVPAGTAAGWRYADPDGREHDVMNCSIAQLKLNVTFAGASLLALETAHAGAYELGMRERDHGVEIAPFSDG